MIQILFHAPEFCKSVMNMIQQNSQTISKLIKEIFFGLSDKNSEPLNAIELGHICATLNFALNIQHDSGEFFIQLLNALLTEDKLFDKFCLNIKRTTICLKCKKKYEDCQSVPFLLMSNVLSSNIQDGIQHAIEDSIITSKIESCCGSTYPVYEFMTPPLMIPVIFDRVVWNTTSTNTVNKVSINKNITIKSCHKNILYSLKGIVLHTGEDTDRGHYYTCICNQNNEWFLLNDSKSKTINVGEVRRMANTDSPSVLIYVHRN